LLSPAIRGIFASFGLALQPNLLPSRRHYTNYLKGLPNIREYRTKIVTVTSLTLIEEILHDIVQA
jgi:tRNA-dihydrouridine synthase